MTDSSSTTTTLDPDEALRNEWTSWHAKHEEARADGHGFLAITGLTWLNTEPVRIAGISGSWSTGPEGPRVDLAPGETLVVDDATVTGEHSFGILAERGGVTAFDGDIAIEIAKRDGHDIVRPRDPSNPFLGVYSGTPAYAAEAKWHIAGRYLPFDEPRAVTVGSVVEELHHVYDAPGEIEFVVDDETFRLTAFPGKAPGSLHVLFTDATSGVTTYAANRSLAVAAPREDGSVVLDFTRAVNLPCAYTDYATCPLPPAENHLPFAVEAGEKQPRERNVAALV